MPTTERGEKRVGQLTPAASVDPTTKIPGEQGTKAVYFTGKQLTDFVSNGVQNQADEIAQNAADKAESDIRTLTTQAQTAASDANTSKNNAKTYRDNAKNYMDAIKAFDVEAALADSEDDVAVEKTINADGSVTLKFYLVKGDPGGQPIPIKQASKMTDQSKLYLYMGSETNYKNGWVYGYTDGAWTALTTYGNGITVDSAMSSTSTNPVQNKVVNTAIAAKYSKPSSGIPKTDLASAVQTSLNNADKAYQKPSTGIPETDLAEAVQTKLNKEASSAKSVTVTLLASGWMASDDMYSQIVTVTGMSPSTKVVIVDVQLGNNAATNADLLEAWELISTSGDPTQTNNGLMFYANSEAPTIDLTVKVGWM